MKIKVDQDKCIGCGACVANFQETFGFEGQYSKVISDKIPENLDLLMRICPTDAISIEGCKCNEECTCGDDCNCNEECHCNDNCNC